MFKCMAVVHLTTGPIQARVFTVNPFHLYQYNRLAFSTPEQGFREACLPFFAFTGQLTWGLWRML